MIANIFTIVMVLLLLIPLTWLFFGKDEIALKLRTFLLNLIPLGIIVMDGIYLIITYILKY